jgi:hypothetical protein
MCGASSTPKQLGREAHHLYFKKALDRKLSFSLIYLEECSAAL